MSVKYQFFKSPVGASKTETAGTLHPRVVNSNTVSFEKVCKSIKETSTFTEGDVKGVVKALVDQLTFHLKQGDKVEIEDLGIFEISLKSKPVDTIKEIRAESIRFSRVNFRPAKSLRESLKNLRVERSSDYRPPLDSAPDVRLERILNYLKEHSYIRSAVCMSLNSCSRYVAQRDLQELYSKGLLIRIGGRNTALYTLNPKADAV